MDSRAQDAAQVFDLLITDKGGPSQAVLSRLSCFDVPFGNLPYSEYGPPEGRFPYRAGRAPGPWRQLPQPVGGEHRPHVLRTTADASCAPYFRPSSRMFSQTFQALPGTSAVGQTGLKIGYTFKSAHSPEEHHEPGLEDEEHDATYRHRDVARTTRTSE